MSDIDPNDPSFYRNMSHNQLSRLWMEHEDQKAYDELELRIDDFYGHGQPEHQGTTDWHESEGGLAHLIEEAYKGNQPQAPAEVIQSRDEHYLNQPYYPPEIMGEMYAEETGKNPFKKPIGHTINRKPEVRLPIMTPLKDESGYTQWQQKNASEDTAFDQAWAIVKMPFAIEGGNLQTDVLYQGRRTGDKNTGYWTPHKSKALAYAMFGPRNDYSATPFVDANEHYPELHMATAPKGEYIDVPEDDEYMGHGAVGAIGRGRVAFHDQEGIVEPYSQKLPDEHIAQIIQNIIDSELYDEEMDVFEEEHYDDDGDENEAWDRIFLPAKNTGHGYWESMYPDHRKDNPEDSRVYEALEEFYGEQPLWDKVTTNDMLVGGSKPHDFVRRLRERGQ